MLDLSLEAVQPLPFVGNVRDDTVLLRDRSLMGTLHYTGAPWHLESNRTRNAAYNSLVQILNAAGDEQTSVTIHFVRHDTVVPRPPIPHRHPYIRQLAADIERVTLKGLRQNDWFITVTVSPFLRMPPSQAALDEKLALIAASLPRGTCRRLGVREQDGLVYNEIAEAMRLVLTSKWLPIPMADDMEAIYTDRAVVGARGIEIQAPMPHYAIPFGLKAYMSQPRVGMLNDVLDAPCRVVMTSAFKFKSRANAVDSLLILGQQMENAGEVAADDERAEMGETAKGLRRGTATWGSHYWVLTLHDDSFEQLQRAAATLRGKIAATAAIAPEGTFGGEFAYWSQLPGNRPHATRSGDVDTANAAFFTSLDGFPAGELDQSRMEWRVSPLRLRTSASTVFDFSLHVDQVGHLGLFGPTRSGKTLFMQVLVALHDVVVGGQGGMQILLDRDRASEIAINAMGGKYIVMELGHTKAAPVKRLPDTQESRSWLHEFVVGLILGDGLGPIHPAEHDGIARGIEFVMSRPPEKRSLAGIRAFMGFSKDGRGAGERLEQWCLGGARGWAFDNDRDEIDLDGGLIGIDTTALMNDPVLSGPTAAYLLHLTSQKLDGRRTIIWIDEFRSFLPDERFARGFEDWILRFGKKNSVLAFATQQPEHVLDHPIGPSLLGQLRTLLLFRNPDANLHAYCGGGKWGDGLHCTAGEFRAVTRDMTVGERSLLIKRQEGSVLCRFDIGELPNHVAVLSGKERTTRLFNECGRNLDLFWSRLHEAKA